MKEAIERLIFLFLSAWLQKVINVFQLKQSKCALFMWVLFYIFNTVLVLINTDLSLRKFSLKKLNWCPVLPFDLHSVPTILYIETKNLKTGFLFWNHKFYWKSKIHFSLSRSATEPPRLCFRVTECRRYTDLPLCFHTHNAKRNWVPLY